MGLSDLENERIKRLTPEEKFRCEQLTRTFCAELIGSKVGTNGSIEGWDKFMGGLHPEAQEIVRDHYRWVNAKIVLRGENEATVIARAVVSCKHKLQTFRPTPTMTVEPSEIAAMTRGLGKALNWAPDPSLESTEHPEALP
jgi:hypothetical protein